MNFYTLPPSVQEVLYGIAGQLEYIADFFEERELHSHSEPGA